MFKCVVPTGWIHVVCALRLWGPIADMVGSDKTFSFPLAFPVDKMGITFCQSSLDVFGVAFWKNELHKMQIIICLMLVIPLFF